ncbi:alpha/beta fold hydrolase [Sphingobium phenoxybenzoativorans]|uniref:Hydrolase n=1 Tax=Sphingobium phenoxybenzoativorans TaxID=1592790 RepID=A0A1W5YR11_9SPHN|nr:alpha/beta fold hydrolase [Sphingobium phenoxybenzoativorans]ARI47600.1 hydrolase [Sphingobium phenoxybenzoativorans]
MDIHYHEAGTGEAVIFIHGSGPGASAWSNFQRNLGHFSQGYRAIALDLPNFGKSTKLSVPIDRVWAYYASVVADFMTALGIDKAHLVGNSLGGGISLKVAMDYPDRVGRLVLMGSAGGVPMFSALPSEGMKHLFDYYEAPGPSPEKLRAFLNVMIYDTSELTEELFAERYEASIDPEIVANPLFTRSRMPSIDVLVGNLPKVTHRTLLIWGRDDRTVTFDSSLILLRMLPDARMHVFSQCGHWAQWEKAAEFNVLVSGFLGTSAD